MTWLIIFLIISTGAKHSDKYYVRYHYLTLNKKISVLDCWDSLVLATLAGVGCSKQLVIIDTDPGIDDALAILTVLGNPEVEVLAITCVRGNADLPQVAVNTLGIIHVAKEEGVSL